MKSIKVLFQYISITILLIFVTIIILAFVNIVFAVMDIPFIIAKNVSSVIAYIVDFLVIMVIFKNIKVIEHISISRLDIKIIIIIVTLFSSLSIVYNNLFTWFISLIKLSPNIITKIFEKNNYEYSTIPILILGLVSLAIVTPIIEELFFRVFSIEFLKKEFSINVSIIISSLVFSIMHLSKIQDSIEIFITAIIIAIIYTKTNNVFYCIIAHMTHNAQYILFNYCMCNNKLLFDQKIMVEYDNMQIFSTKLFILSLFLILVSFCCLIKLMKLDNIKSLGTIRK